MMIALVLTMASALLIALLLVVLPDHWVRQRPPLLVELALELLLLAAVLALVVQADRVDQAGGLEKVRGTTTTMPTSM